MTKARGLRRSYQNCFRAEPDCDKVVRAAVVIRAVAGSPPVPERDKGSRLAPLLQKQFTVRACAPEDAAYPMTLTP